MTIDNETPDAVAVIETAAAAARPTPLTPGDLASVMVPAGWRHQVVNLEAYLAAPSRKKGTATLHSSASFAAYVNGHQEGDRTTLYADEGSATIVAVLNGHEGKTSSLADGGAPLEGTGWGDHRASLRLRTTPEWDQWNAMSGKAQNQVEFAEFIEDHVADIQSPSGADMLELATNFEAKSDASFQSAIRLNNDQRQLAYQETVAARAGQDGRMDVPEEIVLGLRPFVGTEPYEVRARFRYKIASGKLLVSMTLARPDLVLRDAFDQAIGKIADDCGYRALLGLPPAA